MRLAVVAFVFLVSSLPAAAQTYRDTLLFQSGAWAVFLVESSTGERWCAAETDNGSLQTFSISAFSDGAAGLFVFDDRWNLAPRGVNFFVDVDGIRWDMAGTADGISVSLFFNDVNTGGQFLEDLARGNGVTVRNTNGQVLANFSLIGSRNALNTMFDCWERILPGAVDPF